MGYMQNALFPTMPHDDGPEVLRAIHDGRPYGKSIKEQPSNQTQIRCKF